jgi:hypothetical protein
VEAFDGWPRFDIPCTPLEHWKWKFLDNPVKLNTIALSLHEKNIIGIDHGFLLKVKIGDNIITAQHGTDSAIHKDFRGRRIYSKTNDYKQELFPKKGVSFTYWATAVPQFIEMSRRRGYPPFPKPVLNMMLIKDIKKHIEMSQTKTPYHKQVGYKIISKLGKIQHTKISQTQESEITIKKIDLFDDRIEEFWKKINSYHNFIICKTKDYLNWRYCDPKAGKLTTYIALENEYICGFIVCRINKYDRDYPKGSIVELITIPEGKDIAIKLIESALEYFDKESINIIRTWVIKNHPHENIYKRYGFVDSRTPFMVGYKPLDLGEELNQFQQSSANKLHFQIGDVDWF